MGLKNKDHRTIWKEAFNYLTCAIFFFPFNFNSIVFPNFVVLSAF